MGTLHLLFLGPPGSGKGTQAKLLAKEHGYTHIAPGDIFRAEIRAGSELGRLVEGIMAKGDLVPDETTLRVIEKAMASSGGAGVVFDGFPRNLSQAEALDKMFSKSDKKMDIVINLVVSEENILDRARCRRVCCVCGRPYSTKVSPPAHEGVCDSCGGALIVRNDDREETVRDRLTVYHRLTEPLKDYYGKRGLVVDVAGEGEVGEVFDRVKNALQSRALAK